MSAGQTGVAWVVGFAPDPHIERFCRKGKRRPQYVQSHVDIALTGDDIIILHDQNLTSGTVWDLCLDHDRQSFPGLIPVSATTDLDALGEKIYAPVATPRQRVFIYGRAALDKRIREPDLLLGSQASVADVHAAVRTRAALLTVVGHSDGIDMALTERLYACTFLRKPGTGLAPLCQTEQRCTRYPVWPAPNEAEGKGWVIPVEDFQAEMGIMLGCNIVRVADKIFDPEHSFGVRLFRQSPMRAVIATWRMERIKRDGSLGNALVNRLSSGVPLGPAVAEFNRNYGHGRNGVMLCILGDPRTALQSGLEFPKLPERPAFLPDRPVDDISRPGGGALVEAPFLRALIEAAPLVSSRLSRADAEKVCALLDEYIAVSGDDKALEERIDKEVVEFFTRDARMYLVYERFAHERRLDGDGVCPGCLGPAHRYRMRYTEANSYTRQTTLCPGCRQALFGPEGWDVAMDRDHIAEKRVKVTGMPKDAPLLISLVSFMPLSKPGVDSVFYRQTTRTDPDGSFEFVFPDDTPSVPFYFCAIYAKELKFGSLVVKMRKMADGTIVVSDSSGEPVRRIAQVA